MSAARVSALAALAVACGSSGAPSNAADASAPDAPIAHACMLSPAGAPAVLLALDQRHVSAPQMLVLDPGSASSPASVAVQAFANASVMGIPDDIEIARARIDRAWPGGATIDRAPELVGEFALGFAQLSPAPSSGAFAVAWHREEVGVGKPQLRAFDVASWSAGATTEIAVKGDAVLSLVPSDAGYGVVWRDLNAPGVGPVQPLFATLDARGAVTRGPIALAGPHDYPGPAPSIAWTGGRFVAFVGYDDCTFGDAACVTRSVVVMKIGDASVERAAIISALDPATSPGHVASTTFGGAGWIAWSEGDAKNEKVPRTVRVAKVDARGVPVAAPTTLATKVPVATAVAITASELGVVVTWAERGDPMLAENAPGSSRVVVQRVPLEGGTPDAPRVLDATFVDTYGPPTSVALASPRSALVMWAGRAPQDGNPDGAWIARLDCAEP